LNGKVEKKGIYIGRHKIKTLFKKQKTKIFVEKLLSTIQIYNPLIFQTEGTLKEEIAKAKLNC
jgi:hypothetical protein